jgi:hypothetical protein
MEDQAIAVADTLLLTLPNQLGVAYNAHVLEAILSTIAPAPGLALAKAKAYLAPTDIVGNTLRLRSMWIAAEKAEIMARENVESNEIQG